VLDAAAALVFEHGVAGTTLDDVRVAANVSNGQLYHYFTDKEDLVHAVIDRTVQQVLDAQPRLIDLSSWAAIAAWFDGLFQLQADRHAIGGCPIGSLGGELAETDERDTGSRGTVPLSRPCSDRPTTSTLDLAHAGGVVLARC
jgi:AcrR family transcriptional regulator